MKSKIAVRVRFVVIAVAVALSVFGTAPASGQVYFLTDVGLQLQSTLQILQANQSMSSSQAGQLQAQINRINQAIPLQGQSHSDITDGSNKPPYDQRGAAFGPNPYFRRVSTLGLEIAKNAFSCPAFEGTGVLLREDGCAWMKAEVQHVTQFGSITDSAGIRLGAQKELAPGWILGSILAVDTNWMPTVGGVADSGQSFGGGVALKHVAGPWFLAGAATIGSSMSHTSRPAVSGGTMQSDSSDWSGGLLLRGAYEFPFTGWYARPRLDLGAGYTNAVGFQEYGPDQTGLAFNGYQKVSSSIAPALEIGGRIDTQGLILRPYAILGAQFLPDNAYTLGFSFTGPLAQAGTFQALIKSPSVLGTTEIGLQLYQAHGWEVKADYTLAAGDFYLSQTIGLRGAYHF